MLASRRVLQFGWLLVVIATPGCGHFVARQLVQAPKSYPQWLAPTPRVRLVFPNAFLTNFPAHTVTVSPPSARLQYRIVEPADYRLEVASTNWMRRGHENFQFTFRATVPGPTNAWTASPRGTVVLLHGYGVAEFAMAPWALRLASEGWRCVLLDLRGHGKSTGRQIYFGVREAFDLSELLDELSRNEKLAPPVHAFGDSYGAALALRWKMQEPRVAGVVAVSPYASLSNAILNICCDYAKWTPRWLLKPGIKQLPKVLHVEPDELDSESLLARTPVQALFIAAEDDRIVPLEDVNKLRDIAADGSELVVVPKATHEALPYYFEELVPPVSRWLDRQGLK